LKVDSAWAFFNHLYQYDYRVLGGSLLF
jgi:hypothetical protein